jgi:hypothetical protein
VLDLVDYGAALLDERPYDPVLASQNDAWFEGRDFALLHHSLDPRYPLLAKPSLSGEQSGKK